MYKQGGGAVSIPSLYHLLIKLPIFFKAKFRESRCNYEINGVFSLVLVNFGKLYHRFDAVLLALKLQYPIMVGYLFIISPVPVNVLRRTLSISPVFFLWGVKKMLQILEHFSLTQTPMFEKL